ncbi:hypothetical protein ACFVWY_20205 [Streptomyces sp. NPDC058195]|uniref:hypothetical protein n=1 Tax=Streptomyces sp. NPDC058195 TaxID=3346375 RepID=UPI0036EEE38F
MNDGRGRNGRRGTAAALLAGLLLLAGCAAPGGDDAPAGSVGRGVRATLDRRADAVLRHDPDAYLATTDPGATALRTAQRRELANLADVPLSAWEYRLLRVTGRNGGRATADVELRYRITGYDAAPVTADRVVELRWEGTDGRWYVTGDRPGADGGHQLWQQGAVRVARGGHTLVLGVGRSDRELRAIARTTDRAVPAVSDAWPGRWAGRVVVLVPRTTADLAALLGSTADYRGIAAVTTGRTGEPGRNPADRVIVNPEAYGTLDGFGQRVVLAHETTHVATRARTSAATPAWLSEGLADWAAYRAEDREPARNAPELAAAVRRGALPAALPTDADFGFAGDPVRLARAYEGGWTACQLIADHWGEPELRAFYRAVGAHPERDGAVGQALREVLGTTPAEFTALWRTWLRTHLA